jgi:DNA-binding NtrC family response regulator
MHVESPHAFRMPEAASDAENFPAVSLLRPTVNGGHPPRARRALATASDAMAAVVAFLTRVAATEVTLTLVGETGTGKDVLAGAVHDMSSRATGPMVVFDCGSITASLAESELFGHERGAFTGAHGVHQGAFERAHGGTIFLDEIGELPLDLQPRLLRVLENRTVRRVGGSRDRRVDVRVIAATNRSLEAEVAAGRFRQDLYFRLAGAVIEVPSLRERREDLPLLTRALLTDLGHDDVRLSPDALEALARHSWPGNVRELKNTLACAVAFLDGRVIQPEHLRLPEERDVGLDRLNLAGLTLADIEREAIRQTLCQARGNKSRAARSLGIAISTLYEKVKRHGL